MTETSTETYYERLAREYFLSVDRFFSLNTEAFREAFERLQRMVGPAVPDSTFALYAASVAAGVFADQSALQTMPKILSIPIMTVYLHLAFNHPLYLSAELLLAWGLDDTPAQCLTCGLRVPKAGPATCPNCQGAVGEAGAWDRWIQNAAVN